MAVNVHEFIPNVHERPRLTITSDKFKQEFHVIPATFGMYKVSVTKGNLPKELSGTWTRMDLARKAVERYEQRHPGTKAVERDKKVEKRNGAKVRRERTSDVHQGAGNGTVGDDLPGERLNG